MKADGIPSVMVLLPEQACFPWPHLLVVPVEGSDGKLCGRIVEDGMAHLDRAPYSIPRPRLDKVMAGHRPRVNRARVNWCQS